MFEKSKLPTARDKKKEMVEKLEMVTTNWNIVTKSPVAKDKNKMVEKSEMIIFKSDNVTKPSTARDKEKMIEDTMHNNESDKLP